MEGLIPVFIVYCVTTLVTSTDGLFGVFYRIRKQGDVFNCFLCLSVYVSALVSLFIAQTLLEFIAYTLATSGAAIFLHKVSDGK